MYKVLVLMALSLSTVSSLVTVTAVNASTNNFFKFGSIDDLADAIHEKRFQDDSINWDKYQEWFGFAHAESDVKKCIEHRHDLSNNLADYEIYNCYDEHESEEK
jgi:hypothetical protein